MDYKDHPDIGFHTSQQGPCYFSHHALTLSDQSIRHGFFTRNGGISSGLYQSLNCGLGSDDNPVHVQNNRMNVAASMGLAENRLVGLYQTHSTEIISIKQPSDIPLLIEKRPHADGIVSTCTDVGLAILTADCLPVLFAEPSSKIIGACHAGWRGAVNGIIENTIDAMQNLGASLSNIMMVIGPGIHQKSYQIGADMAAQILEQRPESTGCFMADPASENTASGPQHYLFDLPEFALLCAQRAGLHQIHKMPLDTYALPDLFFSHRRATHLSEPDSGRLISVITQTSKPSA